MDSPGLSRRAEPQFDRRHSVNAFASSAVIIRIALKAYSSEKLKPLNQKIIVDVGAVGFVRMTFGIVDGATPTTAIWQNETR